jgi:hypothetical protein
MLLNSSAVGELWITVSGFPVPSQDVTYQTLPSRKTAKLFYSAEENPETDPIRSEFPLFSACIFTIYKPACLRTVAPKD